MIIKGRHRDPDAARAAILTAAEEDFASHGFAGARVESIATASGYNNGLIFRYFTDKLGLYRAVVSSMKTRSETWFAQDLAPLFVANADRAADRAVVQHVIATALHQVFDFYAANPTLRRILAWEAADGWRTFALVHAEYDPTWWIGPVSRFLARAQAAGVIAEDIDLPMTISNALYMAMLFQSFVPRYQLDFPSIDFSSPDSLARGRDQIVRLMLGGIGTPIHPHN